METDLKEPINPIVTTNHNYETYESYLDAKYNGLTKLEYFSLKILTAYISTGKYDSLNSEMLMQHTKETTRKLVYYLNTNQ